MIDKIYEYLEKKIKTNRMQKKRITRLENKVKELENANELLSKRALKWINASRNLNKELEEIKIKYTNLKLDSVSTITEQEKKIKKLEKKVGMLNGKLND